MSETLTPDALHAKCGKVAMIAALCGDFSWSEALRLGRRVWEQAPADFPRWADGLRERGPKAAAWEAAALARELPGGWDLYQEARALLWRLGGCEPDRLCLGCVEECHQQCGGANCGCWCNAPHAASVRSVAEEVVRRGA